MVIDENSFFREATLRICGNLDFEIALQKCLIYLKSFIPAFRIGVTLYDQGLNAIRMIAGATFLEAKKYNTIWPLDRKSAKYFDNPNLPKAKIINRPLTDPISAAITKRSGSGKNNSNLVMFLDIEGAKIGNVFLIAEGKDRYTEEHLKLFTTLDKPFGIAFSNFLRFNEMNRLKDIMADDIRFLHRKLQPFSEDEIVGSNFGLKDIMAMVREVAPLDSPVLLQGETGVGKEVVANAIHTLSHRKDGPFIRVNCGAIPETLIDSELFGHEKGAFTGALNQKRGYFERSEGGTIFLDEVAELPPHAQIRMLRVLQDKEIIRVGGSEQIKVDLRIIAATHQNLEEMVKNGKFRSDLWFRIHVFPIMIPPLRNRKEDVPSLINYFVEKKARELQLPTIPTIGKGEMELLMTYSWPGNVRELENVVERVIILSRGRPLTFKDIVWVDNEEEIDTKPLQLKSTMLDHVVSKHIRNVLKIADGKVNGPGGAAELLGLNPGTLRHRMNKLGIPYGRREKHSLKK